MALRSRPLQPRQRLRGNRLIPQGSRPKGSPHSRFYITRALCKLSPGLRSLRPCATCGNPPHARPPPERGAPHSANSRRFVTRHANGRMARAVATVTDDRKNRTNRRPPPPGSRRSMRRNVAMNCGTLRSLLSVPSTPLKHWLGTRQMGAAEVLICLIALSTTRRTSARHQRPSGFFVAH